MFCDLFIYCISFLLDFFFIITKYLLSISQFDDLSCFYFFFFQLSDFYIYIFLIISKGFATYRCCNPCLFKNSFILTQYILFFLPTSPSIQITFYLREKIYSNIDKITILKNFTLADFLPSYKYPVTIKMSISDKFPFQIFPTIQRRKYFSKNIIVLICCQDHISSK